MEENNNQQPQYQQYQQYQVPQQTQYQQPQPNYQPQYQPQYQQPASTASVFALILGIISILAPVLMILTSINSYMGLDVTRIVRTSFVGLVSGIIAIVLGAKGRKSGLGKAGLTCGIIGVVGFVGIIVFAIMIGVGLSLAVYRR